MRSFGPVVTVLALVSLAPGSVNAADLGVLVPKLKQGGYVLVVRHVETDDSQKDVYPFVFDDMKKQRQLSEQGRQMARDVGAAIKTLGVPIGQIYTSKLNRAIETGALMFGTQTTAVSELTDSGAGRVSAMANPTGANTKIELAIRELVNKPVKPGTNSVLITHKTNIADGFGKNLGDVKEGEVLIYSPNASGAPTLVDRVQPSEW